MRRRRFSGGAGTTVIRRKRIIDTRALPRGVKFKKREEPVPIINNNDDGELYTECLPYSIGIVIRTIILFFVMVFFFRRTRPSRQYIITINIRNVTNRVVPIFYPRRKSLHSSCAAPALMPTIQTPIWVLFFFFYVRDG